MLSLMLGMFFKAATSLERICEYRSAALPQEPPWSVPADGSRPGWPSAGRICFRDVSLRYRPGLERAISGASFDVEAASTVGVVGRTGAGKSSLLVALFRLVNIEAGAIRIDDVRTDTVGLQLLRRSIAIIPQQPLLIHGTVRRNLDPFGALPDTARVPMLLPSDDDS